MSEPAPRRIPHWMAGVIVSTASTVLCLLALEVGARIYFGVEVWNLQDWRMIRVVGATMGSAAKYDPVLGWVQTSGYVSANMNTIALGVRKNGATDASLRTGGVLAVGDSFTAGSEVGDAESWPAQLESLIGRPVTNGGVGGYGTDQILLRAEQLLPLVQPDFLVIGFLSSDILRAGFSSYGRPKPFYTLEQGEPVLRNSPVPRQMPFRATGNVLADAFKSVAGYSFLADHLLGKLYPEFWFGGERQAYVRNESDEVEVTCALLRSFKERILNVRGIPAFLMMQHGGNAIANLDQPEGYARLVSECAARVGIAVIDEFDSLRAVYRTDAKELERYYVMHPGDGYGHMSAYGNAHVARLVADALARPVLAAAITPPELSLDDVPDGRNLLPRSESLPQLFGTHPEATLVLAAEAAGRPREFRVSARGERSEHYVSAQLDLPAAVYILSLEVRADPSTRLKLQLLDREHNGAIGTFDLGAGTSSAARIGVVRQPSARISRLEDGWYHVAVLAGLPVSGPSLVIQLMDASGAQVFEPAGESIRVRAVQLERGRRATPYKATSGPLRPGFAPAGGPDYLGTALAAAAGDAAIASLGGVEGSPGEYVLAAAGGASEHYIALSSAALPAGPYTLSLEVAVESGPGPRVQLLASASQGVIADFDVGAGRATVQRLGPDEVADAGVESSGPGWTQLWLTAALPEGPARLILQLRDAQGQTSFAPPGDSIRIRSVRLQRGEGAPSGPGRH